MGEEIDQFVVLLGAFPIRRLLVERGCWCTTVNLYNALQRRFG